MVTPDVAQPTSPPPGTSPPAAAETPPNATSAAGQAGSPAGGDGPAQLAAPSLSLPKGGGALRGIGEKFSVNAATGTASMSFPLPVSAGRAGFSPTLTLSYDSGAGAGPFGFGWSLSLPAVSRKTDKGLPVYADQVWSDVFVLSGAEDLVPVVDGDGRVAEDRSVADVVVHRFRPRVEGLFARVERWTNTVTGDVSWRSITKDNVTSLFGSDAQSRIVAPRSDANEAAPRIFSWLLRASWDDKGNAVCYDYAADNDENVPLSAGWEQTRSHGTNRYLKRVLYGNRTPNRDPGTWAASSPASLPRDAWMFEVVFDYGERHLVELNRDAADDEHAFVAASPRADLDWDDRQRGWSQRPDPTSSYRAGFEVRTHRRCRRVMLFHHVPDDGERAGFDGLVKSVELDFADAADAAGFAKLPVETELNHAGSTRFGSFLAGAQECSYVPDDSAALPAGFDASFARYLRRRPPPLEFRYTKAKLDPQAQPQTLPSDDLANMPGGLSGGFQLVDLDGEGAPGVLGDVGELFYKAPLGGGRFAPAQRERTAASTALLSGGAQLSDLSGDGTLDVVALTGPAPGSFSRRRRPGPGPLVGEWAPWRPMRSLPAALGDRGVKLADRTGDGRTDASVTDGVGVTLFASLGEDGFELCRREARGHDELLGPPARAGRDELMFDADMTGDGILDRVRFCRNEIAFWPGLGFERFGAKVVFDNCPRLAWEELNDASRLRLIDIDGSGTTDVVVLRDDGAHVFFNQAGNRLSDPVVWTGLAVADRRASITTGDLRGNGTACLIWSSPATSGTGDQLLFVELTGGVKPHLLCETINHVGGETHIEYLPSTSFYFADKAAGQPWVTSLPFPVHVVHRTVSIDHVRRTRFTSRYAYHHGHFDGAEREFRGFGLVEQWDSETLDVLTARPGMYAGADVDASNYVPPTHTKTWFHTGALLDSERISNFFASQPQPGPDGKPRRDVYWREPRLDDREAAALLLPDTQLPDGLTLEERAEACRALRGSMLRQEIYADDPPAGVDPDPSLVRRSATPFQVVEQNMTVRCLQRRGRQRHGVFHARPWQTLTYAYERDHADPRVGHDVMLETDDFGNVRKKVSVGYRRRAAIRVVPFDDGEAVRTVPNPALVRLAAAADDAAQTVPLMLYHEMRFTDPVGSLSSPASDGWFRGPQLAETAAWELTDFPLVGPLHARRVDLAQLVEVDDDTTSLRLAAEHRVEFHQLPPAGRCARLVQLSRTLFRDDDDADLPFLPVGSCGALALTGETYTLAFSAGLLADVLTRPDPAADPPAPAPLLADPVPLLSGRDGDTGGYVPGAELRAAGLFDDSPDRDSWWWIPSGRTVFDPEASAAVSERAFARTHFFTPRRFIDPFGEVSAVEPDGHDLLTVQVVDQAGNVMAAANDYRVLLPFRLDDPNGNRSEVLFDAHGMVAATAVMGKPAGVVEGDSLAGVVADLTDAKLSDLFNAADPRPVAADLLGSATARFVYDPNRFHSSSAAHSDDRSRWLPSAVALITRNTHAADMPPPWGARVTVSFVFSDGRGEQVQHKRPVRAGKLDVSDPNGATVDPRWLADGWVVVNNKGLPVRRFEPFFTDTHQFEFGVARGVSPIVFYDPLGRAAVTLHPNFTFDKVRFGPWDHVSFDGNDTCAPRLGDNGEVLADATGDPQTDVDVAGLLGLYFGSLPAGAEWVTWADRRAQLPEGDAQRRAAEQAAAHANTPTVSYLDVLGRPFLTISHNRIVADGHRDDGSELFSFTASTLDIEGAVVESADGVVTQPTRPVSRYRYDAAGRRLVSFSQEAGARWTLPDVAGRPLRVWDSRGHTLSYRYDALRRMIEERVVGAGRAADIRTTGGELVVQRIEYGETLADQALAGRVNARTRVFRHFDQAGVVTNAAGPAGGEVGFDFKGNLLASRRQLLADHTALPDWSQQVGLQAEIFTSLSRFDALNRAVQTVAAHSGAANALFNVSQPRFDDAGLLMSVDVWPQHPAVPVGLLDPDVTVPQTSAGVDDITYNEKGQRLRVRYHNGVVTDYGYEPDTFRLASVVTARSSASFPGDAPDPADPQWPGRPIQNVTYAYDPVGNVIRIDDRAQQRIFFDNAWSDASNAFIYDALYRLVFASGREHLGQAAAAHSYNDQPRVAVPHPHDGGAMGGYREWFAYDHAGNLLSLVHAVPLRPQLGWERSFSYEEASQIDAGQFSNRLTSTVTGGVTVRYGGAGGFDPHGNMLRMEQLDRVTWDYRDMPASTRRQRVNAADREGGDHDGEVTWYVYDASGARVRKVTARNGAVTKQRTYVGTFERFDVAGAQGGPAAHSRETFHVMDDRQRVAMVETLTDGDDGSPASLVRFQHGNHLGSVTFELDHTGELVSFEEFAPYGATTFQSLNLALTRSKRYRFTGKERDEDSGLTSIDRRCHATWLCRWISCDPLGVGGGVNTYVYANSNPCRFKDPTGLAPDDTVDPKDAAARKALAGITEAIDTHADKHDEGTSPYVGSEHQDAGKPGMIVCACTTFPQWGVEEYFKALSEAYQVKASTGSGLGPLMRLIRTVDNLTKAEEARLLGEKVMKDFKDSDWRGTSLIRSLSEHAGWETTYVATSKEKEKIEKPDKVAKLGVYPALPQGAKNARTGDTISESVKAPVDRMVRNLDKPGKQTSADKTNLADLLKAPFGVGAAESGDHTFVFSHGKVYEVHWDRGSTSPDLFEVSDLATFMSGWKQSAVIAVPR